jgi:hypothetical protein
MVGQKAANLIRYILSIHFSGLEKLKREFSRADATLDFWVQKENLISHHGSKMASEFEKQHFS